MYKINCDVAIIGGGPSGLAAGIAAKKQGIKDVLIIERDEALGGILQQCIHPGFGLNYFDEELTGPEYYERFVEEAEKEGVRSLLNSMVLELLPDGKIVCVNQEYGMTMIEAKSVVLAMGCRERTRGNICTPGSRPSGIYTAGSAQRLINLQNEKVGEKVFILGSGDIGMIMARRMTLEGSEVVAVAEIMKDLSGLTRNRVQCLDDFNIPLLLSHTVTRVVGNSRVEGLFVAKVGQNFRPIIETEEFYPCDTLLLSVGLIPENELSKGAEVELDQTTKGPVVNQFMQTSVPNIFACGNVVHVNDLVDNVTVESQIAGKYAALYALNQFPETVTESKTQAGNNVVYVCPQNICLTEEKEGEIPLYFRVKESMTGPHIKVQQGDNVLQDRKKIKVSPGEMEHVVLSKEDLIQGELVISVSKS